MDFPPALISLPQRNGPEILDFIHGPSYQGKHQTWDHYFFCGGGGLCGEKSMLQSIQAKVDSIICPYWMPVIPWKINRVRQNQNIKK